MIRRLAVATALVVSIAAAAVPPSVAAARPAPVGLPVVEIVAPDDVALAAAADRVAAVGGRVVATSPGVLLAELPPGGRAEVEAAGAVEVRVPLPVDVRPERFTLPGFGPTTGSAEQITLADAWHAAGIDGTGVRIGVVDFFDTRYWNVDEHGPLPVAGVDARCIDQGRDCTSEFFDGDDLGGEDHGVAVVEIIRDLAPGARIFIGQAATVTDYQALVDWFVANDVTIVSRSLGSRYDGPGDGRGALDDVVRSAVARGITWVNSGGNNGDGQYYRHAVRLVGDRVAFGDAGVETFLELRGCVALGGMRWANDWDLAAEQRTDYDLYLWESPDGAPAAGTVLASSQRRQTAGAAPIESITGNRCPQPGRTLYLEVRWLGGDPAGDVLEILDYGNGFTRHTQAAYSAAVSVVDADSAGVVAVGAIDPPTSGTIGFYSSQGPTNDGRVAPHVVAPAGFPSSVYGGVFSGTSAAAPVVAGAAALFRQAGVVGDASALGDLLRNSTIDRGAPGPDNVYGHGELRLPPPPPDVAAPTPSRYVPLDVPRRFLDTRPAAAVGPAALRGELWAGEIRRLPVAGVAPVPAGATAVAVNLVTVRPDRRSYVQALPLWESALGGYSNLNTDGPSQNRANFAIIPVAADGTIALYSTAAGHLVVDVLGYFERADSAVAAGRFVDLPVARRLLDTRLGADPAPVRSGTTLQVPVPTGVDAAIADALVVTVTAVNPTSVGWLQAFPVDRPGVIGTTSTVNTTPGSNAASTAIVPLTEDGIGVHAFFSGNGRAHVIVDVIGYVTSEAAPAATAGRFVGVRPGRAFDSRRSSSLSDGEVVVVRASAAPDVTVPADAGGVVWNLTVVNATRRGFVTGWPADRTRPGTSVLNWTNTGEVRAAAAITGVDASGRARFRLDDQGDPASGTIGHLLVDVFGYFT